MGTMNVVEDAATSEGRAFIYDNGGSVAAVCCIQLTGSRIVAQRSGCQCNIEVDWVHSA
jgi:hypothetical protein